MVKQADSGQIVIITDEKEEKWIPTSENNKLKIMHPTSVEGVEDMIKLGDLHEGGILRNLFLRYNDPTGCKLYVGPTSKKKKKERKKEKETQTKK